MMNTKTTGRAPKMALLATIPAMLLLCLAIGAGSGQALALDRGDTFTQDGNVYRVAEACEYDDGELEAGEAVLVKYGSGKKNPVINTVSYRGEVYEVERIGKNAFNNKKGHKVTSVKLGRSVDSIGSKAFYGCKKLKTIDIAASDVIDIDYSRRTASYHVDEIEIGAKAFAKAGTSNVKVKCGSAKAGYQKACKQALVKKGLRSGAKVVK